MANTVRQSVFAGGTEASESSRMRAGPGMANGNPGATSDYHMGTNHVLSTGAYPSRHNTANAT
jgi:hypothetical protein